MIQRVECARCEGTGEVGVVLTAAPMFERIIGVPAACTPDRARATLRSWQGKNPGSMLTMLVRELADRVTATTTTCPGCDGAGAWTLEQLPGPYQC